MVTSNHHLWWPAKRYRDKLGHSFRNLPCCQVKKLDADIHRLLHIYQQPPTRPDNAVMEAAIWKHDTRACGCYQGENRQ